MAHYLIGRLNRGPGQIELTCMCGWQATGTPEGVNHRWIRHADGEG